MLCESPAVRIESEEIATNDVRRLTKVGVRPYEWLSCMGVTLDAWRPVALDKRSDKSKQSDAEERAARTTKSVPMPDPVSKTVQHSVILQLLFLGS